MKIYLQFAKIAFEKKIINIQFSKNFKKLVHQNLFFLKIMEVRGIEPLTSGLQSPRSAKLSYTPI